MLGFALCVGALVAMVSKHHPVEPVAQAATYYPSSVGVRAAEHNPYGINNDLGLIGQTTDPAGSQPGHQKMREAGVGWVRYWLSWQNVEISDGNFQWGVPDQDINAAIAQGLNVYVTIMTGPAWAHGNHNTYGWGGCGGSSGSFNGSLPWCQPPGWANPAPPFNTAYFQRFVTEAVKHYGDRVKYWGFYNESNDQWMWPEYADPAGCNNRVVQLADKVFKPGADAARAANPSVVIVGPEENDPWFLQQLLSLERYGYAGACSRAPYGRMFDIISIHNYSWASGGFDAGLANFKTVLDQFDKREVWLTETDTAGGHLLGHLPTFRKTGWLSKIFPYRLRADTGVGCGVGGGNFLLDGSNNPCGSYNFYVSEIANGPTSTRFAGTTGVAGHNDFVLLQNPHNIGTFANVQFTLAGGSLKSANVWVPANSRETVYVPNAALSWGAFDQSVSVLPTVPYLPIWAEHADYWNNNQAGRGDQGTTERSDTWYFAEGASNAPGGWWTEDITVFNPGTGAVLATLTYLTDPVITPSPSTTVSIPAGGHVKVRSSNVPNTNNNHSIIVNGVWNDGSVHQGKPAPIVADRTMSWNGDIEGHSSKGIAFPSTSWYFAEGSQGGMWNMYLLLFNPTNRGGYADVWFLTPSGGVQIPGGVWVPARSRVTVTPTVTGEFGIMVKSRGPDQVPMVAERSMYSGAGWTLSTNVEGASSLSQRWLFTEASTQGNRFYAPYFLLANPAPVGANAYLRFRRADGYVYDHYVTVPAGSRVTVDPWLIGVLQNQTFSTEVVVYGATIAGYVPPGIVAERVQYWDGTTWPWYGAAGAMGTP
jgi:hypothetical protein